MDGLSPNISDDHSPGLGVNQTATTPQPKPNQNYNVTKLKPNQTILHQSPLTDSLDDQTQAWMLLA